MIICEFPNCIDLEFCENFLETIGDKIDLFKANFHPITHLESACIFILLLKLDNN